MNIQAAQLLFIEEYVKLKNVSIIEKLSTILKQETRRQKKKKSILDFVGILGKEEATAMKKTIKDGCENIDNNEW